MPAAGPELETTAATTAVGDTTYYNVPKRGEPATAPLPPVLFHGKPLVPVSPRRIEMRDTKMTYADKDDAGALSLYTTSEPIPLEKGETEKKDQPVWFLKIGPNEYLRAQAGPVGGEDIRLVVLLSSQLVFSGRVTAPVHFFLPDCQRDGTIHPQRVHGGAA